MRVLHFHSRVSQSPSREIARYVSVYTHLGNEALVAPIPINRFKLWCMIYSMMNYPSFSSSIILPYIDHDDVAGTYCVIVSYCMYFVACTCEALRINNR